MQKKGRGFASSGNGISTSSAIACSNILTQIPDSIVAKGANFTTLDTGKVEADAGSAVRCMESSLF